jgi:hypothetical protein
LDRDAGAVLRADWIEIQLASSDVSFISIDEMADYLRDDPTVDSADEEKTGDEGKWAFARGLAEEGFEEVRSRSDWLGTRYPIRFEEPEVLGWDGGSGSRELFRFLTLLRAKQILGAMLDGGTPDPGYLFEELVTRAAGSYIRDSRSIRLGEAGGSRGSGLPASLPDAIKELARRMNEEASPSVTNGTGDYRADTVTWLPFGDERPGQLVMLIQATISERDWQTKQIPKRWKDGRLINLVAQPVPAVAFVESISLYPGDYWRGVEFDSIPMDRLRIASLLADKDIDPSLLDRLTEWSAWAMSQMPEL